MRRFTPLLIGLLAVSAVFMAGAAEARGGWGGWGGWGGGPRGDHGGRGGYAAPMRPGPGPRTGRMFGPGPGPGVRGGYPGYPGGPYGRPEAVYPAVPGRGGLRRGQFLPRAFDGGPVLNPRQYHLRTPPPGYVWYGVGRDAYLVQRSTGMILDTAPGAW